MEHNYKLEFANIELAEKWEKRATKLRSDAKLKDNDRMCEMLTESFCLDNCARDLRRLTNNIIQV